MQSIVVQFILLLSSMAIVVLSLLFVHFAAIRLGHEKGVLTNKPLLAIFLIAIVLFLVWTGFPVLLLASTVDMFPQVALEVLLAMGFAIDILAMCFVRYTVGPVIST